MFLVTLFVDELMNLYNFLTFLNKDLFNNGGNDLNLLIKEEIIFKLYLRK